MGRDGIKIVEFDQDGDRLRSARSKENKGMKIVEFDNDPAEGAGHVATAQNIGPIKIMEFDDDRPAAKPSSSGPQRTVAKPIKIRDFGAEEETGRKGGTRKDPNIKIMEFD